MKLKITRPDGTIIEAEGTVEECEKLMGAPPPVQYHFYPSYPYPVYPWYPPTPYLVEPYMIPPGITISPYMIPPGITISPYTIHPGITIGDPPQQFCPGVWAGTISESASLKV
jgi:hypothetical protein